MKKTILAIIILACIAVVPIYQLYALNSVEFQSFSIQQISLDNNLHFVVQGSGILYNPTYIPVTIKEVKYSAYLENEEIMNGTIMGKTISSHSEESFPFEQTIDWVPDVETALTITAGKNVTMTISTQADVSYLYFFTITGKKQTTIEVGRILKPLIGKQISAISNAIGLFF
jgi:LEA14-like dessication related protein